MILVSIVILPLIEIFVFIEFGNLWGFWPTVGAIFLTAFLGCLIVRHQGLAVIRKTQQEITLGYAPAENVIVGACLLFAAMLLVIPGFVTDLIGFLLLIPIFRRPAVSIMSKRVWGGTGKIPKEPGSSEAVIIEGVFNDVTNNKASELEASYILPPKD